MNFVKLPIIRILFACLLQKYYLNQSLQSQLDNESFIHQLIIINKQNPQDKSIELIHQQFIMEQCKSAEKQILTNLYHQNQNSIIYKEVIAKAAKDIEQRTYWYFISSQAEFLSHIYDKKINREALKKRIQRITQDTMTEVMKEIQEGKLVKIKEEEQGRLDVQLGIDNFYDQMPPEEDRGRIQKEKIKKIQQQFKAFKQAIDEKKRRHQEKKLEKLNMQEQFRKSLEKQKQQEHRQQIKKKIQSLKKKEEERKVSNEKYKAFLQQYNNSKPLHVMMEQYYKQKIQLPVLEESRRKLKQLTHRKKPTLEEINDHDRLYMEKRQNRPEKLIQSQTIDISFKSHFYQEEEEKLKAQKQFQQYGPQWDFLEKQKRYSQFVKDKVKPKISLKLKKTLQQNLSGSRYKEVPDRSKVIEVGKNYLEFMRNLQKKRSATPQQDQQGNRKSRYVNYLEEMRAKSEYAHVSSMDWERDMRSKLTSQLQKREKVIMKSKQLQQKAMRGEKFIIHNHYGNAQDIIAKKKQIDETLLSSIKAKVAVLRDAQA